VKAPKSFKSYVDSLIRKAIRYNEGQLYEALFDEVEGTNCWGCTHHLYGFLGIALPVNAHEAEKILVPTDKPDFGVTVVFRSHELGRRPHCGFMEDERTVVQCALATRGIARLPLTAFMVSRTFLALPEDLRARICIS
jgi:hypothetical protein